jgi:hypothetical protein
MEDKQENKTLIDELGLSHLSEEQKNQMNDELAEILQNRVITRVLEVMTEDEKKELDRLVTAGDDTKTDEFLSATVPGLELIVDEEFESLKREMIKRNEDLKDALSHKKSE